MGLSSTEPQPLNLIGPAPLSCDEAAIREREAVDYSIRVTEEMAASGTSPRTVRIYADGIYDLFHQGHAKQLLQAKTIFPKSKVYLIAGCCNDQLTNERKGRTVLTEQERYEALRHCRYVDEVLVDAPWTIDMEFLEKNKIDFVAQDKTPYTLGTSAEDNYQFVKERGMFVATQRTEGVSTSDMIARIVRDYDTYVRRNLARGYSRQDLNLSFLRGQRYAFQNAVDEVKTEVADRLLRWEEQSKEMILSFINMFTTPTPAAIENEEVNSDVHS